MKSQQTNKMSSAAIRVFRAAVWRHYKESGRHDLPWRKTRDPYRILVSEVMLQQTQVPRVREKYTEFLRAFPNVRALANAPLSDVLCVWSGLGYNRRAKYLRDAAKIITRDYGGKIPQDFSALRALPGIGPYTAAAIRAFAFNEPDVLIETNIRAALIYAFFSQATNVYDREFLWLLKELNNEQEPREWNWALMDWGAHIKKLHGNPSRLSKHYVRQSKFEGSLRQARGAILRSLTADKNISGLRNHYIDRYEKALKSLARERLIRKEKGTWQIA